MVEYLRHKKFLVTSLLCAATVFVGSKIYEYAAPPTKPKECAFTYPPVNDGTKPTNITITALVETGMTLRQIGGFINDASCLNRTPIFGIAEITSADDVRHAIAFAKIHHLKITPAGQKHSMGGQSFVQGGLVLDMKGFKAMHLDEERSILTVESGAVWGDIQQYLDQRGFAIKAMQSINIFTVGGTLSVNAHGIAHDPGPIAPTVRAMRVMTSDGTILETSPTKNSELFRSVLGGYGLFGVILDVDLDVMGNEMYEWHRDFMDYRDFPAYFKKNIEGNDNVGLLYGRLSMSPLSYLRETMVHRYEKVPFEGKLPPLQLPKRNWIKRLVLNMSKSGRAGQMIRWFLEKRLEPKLHLCTRNTAMSAGDECLVTRNQEMFDSMGYLKNRLPDTDILQEYFIPHEKMPEFIDGLRTVVKENGANLLNVTIRIVKKDTVTSLPYAKEDMFAFVLYFNQRFNERESKILEKTTVDLIDVATGLGGTYYLPYQLFYSPEQLRNAYPEIDAFFKAKRIADPDELFMNTMYATYGKAI